MRKIALLSLLVFSAIPLVGCDSDDEEIDVLADRDFDGLYDYLDPTPDDNKTGFVFNDSFLGYESNEILIPVDYRNFVFDSNPIYNKDLAQMMAVIANYSYDENQKSWSIKTSAYSNEESEINAILVQFGFKDVEYVRMEKETEIYDTCGFYFGNHVFVNEGKKYQVIMASIEGYTSPSCWYSNFDIGADNEGYYEIEGQHPEWTNKKNHKGFDVTSNRAIPLIKQYMNKVKADGCEQIVAVTGHSRGGALTNLVGKLLKDEGIKNVAYAFNGCRTTQESDETILKSYTNIFNVDSINDYVGDYPFEHMGFTKYGTNLHYNLSENNEYYKSLFNHDFSGNDSKNIAAIDAVAELVFPTREKLYEYSPVDPNISEFVLCESLQQAQQVETEIKNEITNMSLVDVAKCEILENTDEETSSTKPYKVQYYSKPIVMFKVVGRLIVTAKTTLRLIDDILDLASGSVRYVTKYIAQAAKISEVEFNLLDFAVPHLQKTCVAGAYVAKE